jgi:hypothetical protein
MTLAPWVFGVSHYQVGKQPVTLLYHAGASCCQLVCLLMAQSGTDSLQRAPNTGAAADHYGGRSFLPSF